MYHSNSHFSSPSMIARRNKIFSLGMGIRAIRAMGNTLLYAVVPFCLTSQCSGLIELNEEAELYVVVLWWV